MEIPNHFICDICKMKKTWFNLSRDSFRKTLRTMCVSCSISESEICTHDCIHGKTVDPHTIYCALYGHDINIYRRCYRKALK